MSPRKISIVIATFNGSKYIAKQLNSILTQTLKADEIIICDDCSTDNTVAVLSPYLKKAPLKLFVNDSVLGVAGNFKKATSLVERGNWIVFADQDDIWMPQKLEKLAAAMTDIDDNATPSLIYSDLSVIDKDDKIISQSFWNQQKIKPEKITLATLLYGNVVTGCTVIINYAMAEELFLIDDDNYFHDEWLGLIGYTFGKAKILNETLVLYRQHENNVTFSEEYRTPGFISSIKSDLVYLLGKKKFLARQFDLARAFLKRYHAKLSAGDVDILENFINQENKNYIAQRVGRRITYSQC